jgi:hypothetical protein
MPLSLLTVSRNRKLATELRRRDDACGNDIAGLEQILVARDDEVRMRDQRRGQKRGILWITWEVGHFRGAADVYRPHPKVSMSTFIDRPGSGLFPRGSPHR